MNIADMDLALVQAFVRRELEDFVILSDDRRQDYIRLYMEKIRKKLDTVVGKADFIIIESVDMVGLTTRELRITPVEWGRGHIVRLILPPTPKGGVGLSVVKTP